MLTETITIADEGTISGALELKGYMVIGIDVPTIDTAILYLLGSKDGVTYRRVQKPDGSGDLNLASGTGGKMWVIAELFPFRWLKVESSATQSTGAVVLTVCAK
ncbi:MAG: hypothetical protein QME51_04650 [Planctomycetota bacterium]|nr:hypothetical protein [Planctomycetota bacterium]